MTSALGVHLVGSVCGASSAEESFRKCCSGFPSRLRRIPDGEPASRQYFIKWQFNVFEHTPEVIRKYDAGFNSISLPEVSPSEVERIVKSMPPLKPGYADAAIESYPVFKRLRDEGVIPPGVRFQVSIPTAGAIMALVRDGFQLAVEPFYEEALLKEVERIQTEIPKKDLAIQWDVANEICTLEGAYWPHFHPYFEPVWEGTLDRIVRQSEAIHPEVELGYHFCYGDMGNKHFIEPKDTGLLTKLSADILKNVKRQVNWMHMPVPKDRDDVEYFTPLGDLELESTELYLGLVHANDEEGTRKRMDAASKVIKKFGIASECGMGRTPPDNFESIAHIASTFSSPVVI
jgi:hypothetical protein